ncbi:MAG TPA: HAD-IA family hydrolase [Caulobacterales bacterium]|nr:HAD-IA family hydrolase [Caulobacterales bacterium]
MKRLAVFDIDGTIVDSRRAITEAVRDAWIALGLEPPPYEQSRRVVGLNLLAAVQTLAPTLSPDRYPELAVAYKEAFLRNREGGQGEPLYEGARQTLRVLKDDGWVLGIATGKARRGLEHILKHHGVHDWFDAVFCADDGPGKPDPHMLNCNMRALDIEPSRTVMVGDTSFDMAMARAANCYALGVSWGFHTAEEIEKGGAHEIAHDFSSLLGKLERWRTQQQQQQQQ